MRPGVKPHFFVNIISALTITHAVFLLVCSIAGIVTSVKPRLLVGTFVSITNTSHDKAFLKFTIPYFPLPVRPFEI